MGQAPFTSGMVTNNTSEISYTFTGLDEVGAAATVGLTVTSSAAQR